MKKVLSLFVFLLLNLLNSFATHNSGGIITYRHISGTTYEATVITYAISGSISDTIGLELYWGDGSMDTIPLVNDTLTSDFIKNIYTGTHTYSSDGSYVLHVQLENWSSGIINLPNSVNVPFYLETFLVIDNSVGNNTSAYPSTEPILSGFPNEKFSYNPTVYDADGDCLSFELISTLDSNGNNVNGYTIPVGVSIDPINGEFTWDNVSAIGQYAFTIKVNEFRNGILVGYVLINLNIDIAGVHEYQTTFGSPLWNTDNASNYVYTLNPNDSIQLNVYFANTPGGGPPMGVKPFGEPFLFQNTASFNLINQNGSFGSYYSITYSFKWKPEIARCAPYFVCFRGDQLIGGPKDLTLMIFVRDQTTTNCDSTCNNILSISETPETSTFTLFPNPASTTLTIQSANTNLQSLKILNSAGQLVTLSVVEGLQTTIDISHLPTGLYHLLLEDKQGRVVAKKLVVAR
ncbi:MAG: T9SS type A sorting domain-containing protein [Bacteroidia bacterium]